MTILSATVPRKDYTGNGATQFAYDWKVNKTSDLGVYVAGVLLTYSTDYTITGLGTAGGNVVFLTPPANGVAIEILSTVVATQETDWSENDPNPAQNIEDMADKNVRLVQQLIEVVGRAPKFSTFSLSKNAILGEPSTGKFLRWDDPTHIGVADIVPLGSIGIPVSLAQGGTGGVYATADALRLGIAAAGWKRGADITTDLGVLLLPNPLDGNYFVATSNATITSILSTGVAEGTRIAIFFSSNPLLTFSGNLSLLGAVNYQTIPGDLFFFIKRSGSIWQEENRQISGANIQRFWRGDGTWKEVTLVKESGGQVLTIGAVADTQILQRSGTNLVGAALPSIFTSEFVSSDQTVAVSSVLNVAHGFGAKPKFVQVTLKNATAELGYSIGDEIIISGGVNNGSIEWTTEFDATNVTIVASGTLGVLHKTTQVGTLITAANWRYVVRAWK